MVLIESILFLSVYLPHDRYDEGEHDEAMETIREVMEQDEDSNIAPYAHDARQTHIFLVTRTVLHPMHMHWLKHKMSHICWSASFSKVTPSSHVHRNLLAQTAIIHGAVHGLAVWLNKARSQVMSPTA